MCFQIYKINFTKNFFLIPEDISKIYFAPEIELHILTLRQTKWLASVLFSADYWISELLP